MKKIVTLLLAITMIVSVIVLASCGCQKKPVNTTPVSTDPTEPTTALASSSEPISEPTASVEPTTATEMQEPTAEPTSEATEPTAEPTQEPHIHTWDDGVVTKEATHTEGGEIKYTCIICGEIMVEKTDPKEIVPGYVEVRREVNQWGRTIVYYDVTLPSGQIVPFVIAIGVGDFTDGSSPIKQFSLSKVNWVPGFGVDGQVWPLTQKMYIDGVLVAQYEIAFPSGEFRFGDNVDDVEMPKAGTRHTLTFVTELVETPENFTSSDDLKTATKTGIEFTFPEIIIEIVE